jgi:GAF domain-containing protein
MRKNPERLEALRRCLVLESSAEQAYDDITRLLATSLGVPMVMFSLLDEQRDWFKSAVGAALQASPASTSFCEAFFHSDQAVILAEDTRLDPRYAGHPLVLGAPHIRFYAAARLEVEGQTVGTLCAYDVQPHQVSVEQIAQLKSLAESAMDLLHRRLPNRTS